jgi:ribonuclease HI
MGVKHCQHPAEMITLLTENNKETSTIQIFTDGSKSEQGRSERSHIQDRYPLQELKIQIKQKMHNEAEQLGILRALEYIENLETEDKTATIYTDSRMTLDS